MEVKITSWYSNGSPRAFHDFCLQNQGKSISLKLINESVQVKGIVYRYIVESGDSNGIFILLNRAVTHPAFYCLEDIECLHSGIAAIETNA